MTNSDDNTVATSKYEMFDDPLYLSTSDQPVLQIVSHEFNGDNFVSWKRDVYHALIAKNKEGFVDGTCKPPPKTDKTYHQWIRCDLLRRIRESLQYVSSSKELWSEIADRYCQSNSIEIYQLKKDLGSITQENASLVDYYNKMKRTWESIDVLDPLPLCTCGALDACTLNAKLIQFLMGMNHAYENVKTHVLTLEPLPPLNKAFALLHKIERQKHLDDQSDVHSDAVAFTSLGNPSDSPNAQKKPKLVSASDGSCVKECHYCHNLGHTKTKCFKLRDCTYCGKKGHARETCYRLKFGSSSGGRHYRGRGRNTYGRGQNFRKSANAAEMFSDQYNDQDLEGAPTNPLSDSYVQTNANTTEFDPQMVNGLVSTVMEQVLKAINQKSTTDTKTTGLSSTNFAGIIVNSIIDTGASDHMTPSTVFLTNVRNLSKSVIVGLPDGTLKHVKQIGDYCLTTDIQLRNVLVVLGFQHNLLSVGRLLEHYRMIVTFYPTECVFQDLTNKARLFRNSTYAHSLNFTFQSVINNYAHSCSKSESLHLFHNRLGHSSIDKIKHVKGPYKIPSYIGARYFLTILDDSLIKAFLVYVQNQFGTTVKIFYSDNRTEFLQKFCHQLFTQKGILHQRSLVGKPQQNGRVERKHMHLLETARALRIHAHLPIKFWSDCILTATHLVNKMPTPILQWKSPHEILFGEAPNYADLRVFGSLCFAKPGPVQRDKFAQRSRRCIFIGYPFGQKGYKVYDLEAKVAFVIRDSIPQQFLQDGNMKQVVSPNDFTYIPKPDNWEHIQSLADTQSTYETREHEESSNGQPTVQMSQESSEQQSSHAASDIQRAPTEESGMPANSPSHPQRPSRHKQMSTRLHGYHLSMKLLIQHNISSDTEVSYSFSAQILAQMEEYSSDYAASLCNVFSEFEPATYQQACTEQKWIEAMNQEISALEKNKTWDV
ncbi:hypothetical protein RND81_14G250800 [Saponaria officinalis]|uniref:Integrase catalytic domain-containing protein n=1 Tax=Saponaria officinalis TaxID=3572 RepID=A0AAW1GTH5_SAPOF